MRVATGVVSCPKIRPRGSGAHREMGPTLRSTPLSPAVGSRGERLSPDVSKAPCRPKPIGCDVVTRRSRRCRFCQGPVPIRRSFPTARQFRDLHVDPDFKQMRLRPKALLHPRSGPAVRPCRYCALAASTFRKCDCPKTLLLSKLGRAAFAIASMRFQNPSSAAGFSAIASEGPIPVSMSGRCAVGPIRATRSRPSYPLLLFLPVDSAG